LDRLSGAEASTAVSAAMRSVWRTLFKIVPFAGARAEASPAMWLSAEFLAGWILRIAPSRSGTTAGASTTDRADTRSHGGIVAVRSPRSHAGPWIRFSSGFFGPRRTVRDIRCARHLETRRCQALITAWLSPTQTPDCAGQPRLVAGVSFGKF
jgi:hypothetical protein